MRPPIRKLVLTAHVGSSVGWAGAVACVLALSIVGATSGDAAIVRGVYVVLEPIAWFVLVPLALASLITGVVQSLGTPWGLFRHYWIVFKLLINVFATLMLLAYTGTLRSLAVAARDPRSDIGAVRDVSPVLHASLALLLLLVATALAVYKPRGLTPYGQRKWRAVS